MPRRKVTFVYDPSVRESLEGTHMEQFIGTFKGVDPLSVTFEELPDPPIVEEFVVRITSAAIIGPLRAHHGGEGLIGDILRGEFHVGRTVEVERRA